MKYYKKGLCKVLSIILAVAMLLTSSIGITQAYALEDGQPTETNVQNEQSLGVSEGTVIDEMLDSGTPLEEKPSPQADSDAPEATLSDAEETGLEHNPATPSDANEIQNRGMLYGLSEEIGVGTAVELEDAINKLVDGDTIKLTANIDYNKGIVIDGITMTFDVGQYKLNITNSDTSGTGCGLEAKNGGTVTLLYTTGELNAFGHYYGVRANGSSTAMLTNATATGENGYGAFAVDNSEITVLGDVEAVKNGSDGVVAWQSSNITVRGDATGNSLAAKTESYSTIHIEGDATTNGTETGDVGVFASSNGKITVDGVISVVKPENYVRVNGANFKIDQKILPTTQSGYHTYMHPSYTAPEDSVVWVKQADTPSTVIEVSTSDELKDALDALSDGDTIKLMANIDYNDSVTISKEVTFDVGQYTLNIIATEYNYLTGLEVTGSVSLISTTGELNVTGSRIGVMVGNGEAVSATVTNATATQPHGIGIHATSVQPKTSSVVVQGNVNAPHTGVYAFGRGSTVTVHGNVNATDVGAEAESDASIVVYGDIKAESCGAKIVTDGRIVVQKDITTTGADSIGAWIKEAGSVRIDGDITAVNYIKLGSTIKLKGDGVADPDLSGYTKYTDVNDRVVRVKGVVVPSDKACEIGEKQYATLDEAIAAAKSGEITTIKLLQSITHHEPVVINGKSITFALGGFDLTIDTSEISNSTGLWVLDDGKVSCTGSGKLNVVGSDFGVRASGGSELHISGSVTARQYAVMAGSASGIGTPKVTVEGDVTVTGQDVNAWSEVEAVSVGGYATVTIGGNVTANRTDEMQLVTAVYSNASNITIGKNVTTQGSGVNAQNGANVTIGGALYYNPTGSGDQAYIKVGYPVVAKTADDFEPTSIKPEHKEYKNGDNVVWVKEAPAICTIGAQKFTSLNAAIASVPAGRTATITLLQSITHTKHIRVEKKTINLDLGDHNLLLDTSADGSYTPALMVIDGGKLNLIGSGTGEFNIKSHMTAISAVGMNTKATVHNVVAGDSTGVNMVGSGDYLDSSTVTVLGSITVGNGNGVEVNAKNGKVVVVGNITAGRIGVYIWSNPGTQVTVNGDITVDGDSSIAGIRAYGATTVAVTGDVTVSGTNCVGVHASGSTIKVDGNVASSGKGAHSDTNGKVEITGSLSAGSPFITVGTTEMTADQGTKTGGGSFLYTDGANTVQIRSVGVPGPIYTITIQNDANGTASANVNSAAQGKEITLTASANGNYRFKEWQVISGGVIITGNKFTMPANNVTIKAVFEETSVQTYTVTVNGSHASTTGAGSYTKDAIVNIYAGNLSNYTFAGWTSSDVTITGASSKNASFVMPDKAVTVTANWSCNSGGQGGSGGGGDGYTPTPIIPTDKQPYMPTIAKSSVSGIVKDGILSATITDQMVKDAIKAAQDAAKKSSKELDGIALDFNVTGSGSYTNLNAAIDARATERLKEAGVKLIKIGSAVLDVTLDMGAIAEIDKQSNGMIMISAKRLTKLSDAAKKLIGNRPVFDITVSYQKNGKTEYVSNFGKGAVTMGIAYKATVNESKGNLFGIYVDKDGKPQLLTNSSYDNTGRLIFSRNRLSTYGVGYKAPAPAFSDIAKHWAKDNIDFIASRDLISGASATTFAPNTDITRADFLMALGRLSGADVSGYKVSSFSDVKATDTDMPYIEWAVKNKIVSGYGNGKFGPNDSITREQMAMMMVNYAKATGYKLHVSIAAVTFADNAKISAYAKDAVKAIQQTGVINGKYNNSFDPQGNTTRAEAATILRRFVELVIDEGMARGWVQNDAGQWQWIGENGKPAIGWLTAEDGKYHYYFTKDGIVVSGKWKEIDGKWYYFNADGSLAKDTKVDHYEVGPDGVRKTK